MKFIGLILTVLLFSVNSFAQRAQLAPGEKMILDNCYTGSNSKILVFLGTYFPTEANPSPPAEINCEFVGLSSTPFETALETDYSEMEEASSAQ